MDSHAYLRRFYSMKDYSAVSCWTVCTWEWRLLDPLEELQAVSGRLCTRAERVLQVRKTRHVRTPVSQAVHGREEDSLWLCCCFPLLHAPKRRHSLILCVTGDFLLEKKLFLPLYCYPGYLTHPCSGTIAMVFQLLADRYDKDKDKEALLLVLFSKR